MRLKLVLAFVALAASSLPSITFASARVTVDVFMSRDKNLSANFTSDTTCNNISGITSTDIQWAELTQKINGVTQNFSNVVLAIRYQNACSGDDLIMTGIITDVNGSGIHVSVKPDLASGHLDGVVHVATDPDAPVPPNQANLAVNLNWTATGPATKTVNRSRTRDGGVVMINNFTATSRPAQASGSVSGTLTLANGKKKFVNLLSDPSFQASMSKGASGSVTIVKKVK
jgi:hypothetical protein